MAEPFPIFFYDSNNAFGMVESLEDWETLISKLVEGDPRTLYRYSEHRDEALKFLLDGRCMTQPEFRSWSHFTPNAPDRELDLALERDGPVANFGWRREHLGGDVTLRDWLRAKGWLDRFTSDRNG